jgi:hypothetical protein
MVSPDSTGKLYLGLVIADGAMRAEIFLADKGHVDDVVRQTIAGLKAAAHDLRQQDESLEVVKVIPYGTSIPVQGEVFRRTGRPG